MSYNAIVVLFSYPHQPSERLTAMTGTHRLSLVSALCISVFLLTGFTLQVKAGVTSLTLGITAGCPYGLAG